MQDWKNDRDPCAAEEVSRSSSGSLYHLLDNFYSMCKCEYCIIAMSIFYFYQSYFNLIVSSPVPPPRPDGREVWENALLVESAAGVALFSGLIHVSVRAKSRGERWLA